jgi:hypothetical protein
MSQETHLLPEEILVAVLHKVGPNIRLVDDERLASAFNEAAEKSAILRPFRWHPQYFFSQRLSNALQVLDLGGSIVRENAPTKYFTISRHTAGSYGETTFSSLAKDDQAAISDLADKLREAFAGH